MTVISDIGKGSQFSFDLKMKDGTAHKNRGQIRLLKKDDRIADKPAGDGALFGRDILVAEDDEDNRNSMGEMLDETDQYSICVRWRAVWMR